MICIRIQTLLFEGRHGATAPERRQSRRFEADVEVTAPIDRAAESDNLKDTIDYDWLSRVVMEIGTGAPCHLLETLAVRMVKAISARYPEARVMVEVRKLNPPCPGHPRYTAARYVHSPEDKV